MKTRTHVVTSFAFLLVAGVPVTASPGRAVASLRFNESLEPVVAGLEAFFPTYMEQEGVPGVAIVAVEIAHRALGGNMDAIRTASHLEFNHRGPFLGEL